MELFNWGYFLLGLVIICVTAIIIVYRICTCMEKKEAFKVYGNGKFDPNDILKMSGNLKK